MLTKVNIYLYAKTLQNLTFKTKDIEAQNLSKLIIHNKKLLLNVMIKNLKKPEIQ
jgi:hypothetical protein